MATFPDYKPVYPATRSSEPVVRIAKFGDGYEHRLSFGLNQNPKKWQLTFDLSDEDADIVEAFLDARAADSESFDWTPPNSVISYKWISEPWNREMYDFQRSRITVTFRQVFEP